ncbi:MAG: DUF5615 family PIN-like protein [Gammaproteobacteria bacterium]
MTIRLLLNENVPAPSVTRLRELGFDILSVSESFPGLKDAEVLSIAVREQRWLITFDRDYGELLFARGHLPPPPVILLRVPSYRPIEPAAWIIELCRDEKEHRGRFTVFNGSTVRSRPLLHDFGNESGSDQSQADDGCADAVSTP